LHSPITPWHPQPISNDPTLEEIPEAANQPATKADVRAAVDELEQRLNSRFHELMRHFTAVAETIRRHMAAANQDETLFTEARRLAGREQRTAGMAARAARWETRPSLSVWKALSLAS